MRRINVFSHSERSSHHIEFSGGQQLLKTQYQSVANKLPVYVDLSLYPSTHIYLYDENNKFSMQVSVCCALPPSSVQQKKLSLKPNQAVEVTLTVGVI